MTLAIVGIVSGTITAVALHLSFRHLRKYALTAFTVIGWILILLAVVTGGFLTQIYLSMRTDPYASMAPFWGTLAMILGILLLVCAGIGIVHWRRLKIAWFKAFGVLMSEAGVALLAAMFLNQTKSSIAEILRGSSSSTEQFLDSLAQTHQLVAFFNLALIIILIFLELFGYFIYRQDTLQTDTSSAAL